MFIGINGLKNPDGKWNKRSGDPSARAHPAKLPTCEKEFKKKFTSSESTCFYSQEIDASRCLEEIGGQLNLGKETVKTRKLLKMKLNKGHAPASVSNRT